MADVSKVHGPSGPTGEPGKKEKPSVDADKFQQAMRKRVSEVSKVDPDEQKKRKRQEEAEEEEPEGLPPSPATPPELVTPFSLEEQTKKATPLDMQTGPSTPSPTEKTETAPPVQKSQEPPPSHWTPEGQGPIAAGPPKSHPEHQKQKVPDTHQPTETKKEPLPPPPLKREVPPEKLPEGLTSAELEAVEHSQGEDTTGFFKQVSKKIEKQSDELTISNEEEEGIQTPTPHVQEEKKEKEKILPGEITAPGLTPVELPPGPLLVPQTLTPYLTMHPRVQELFDRMVGVMTVMNLSGMTETTITLNTPQFASSIFFGAQIIIQEFATAPQAFNIQLNATPQAVALFQANTEDLMAAFQSGNYTFRINRLETGYLAGRPLFKRKEGASGDTQDQTGDSRQ
jgi:hypothetical protein